jgi:hypothetical protein
MGEVVEFAVAIELAESRARRTPPRSGGCITTVTPIITGPARC